MSSLCLRVQSSWEIRESHGALVLHSAIFSKKMTIRLSAKPTDKAKIVEMAKAIYLPMTRTEALALLIELTGALPANVENLLEHLIDAGVIIATNCDESVEPRDREYDRLRRFLASFESSTSSGQDFLQKLQSKTVVLVGLGSYGSFLASSLARIGIGRLIAFDHDRVEASNLDRQILYTAHDVGSLKAQAALGSLRRIGGKTDLDFREREVRNTTDITEAVLACDLAINTFGFEKPGTAGTPVSRIINDVCITYHKPCLNLGGNWCGPFFWPGISPCYFCAYETVKAQWGVDPTERSPFIQKRMLYPMIEMTASMGEYDAVGYLSGAWLPRSRAKITKINWWSQNAVVEQEVVALPNCRCKGVR